MDSRQESGAPVGTQKNQSEEQPIEVSRLMAELDQQDARIAQLHSEERFEEALSLAQEAISLVKEHLGESHARYATALNNLAAGYYSMGDFVRARVLYEESLELMQQRYGESHPSMPSTLNNLGSLNKKVGEYTAALQLFLRALQIYRGGANAHESALVGILHNLGILYDFLGKYSDALPIHLELVELRRRLLGEEHPDYIRSLDRLASAYLELGDYDTAELWHLRALEARKSRYGPEHPDVASSLNNLAALSHARGNYSNAIALQERAISIERAHTGKESARLGTSLLNLAEMHRTTANYEAAEPLYIEARAILLATVGERHPDYATATNNLGLLYQAIGRYRLAEELLQKALELRRSIFGVEHVDVAMSLSNLAVLNRELGNYRAAEPGYRQASEILRRQLGDKHPDVATSLSNLAALRWDMGNHELAEAYLRQALDIERDTLGNNHPRYAVTLHNLAALLRDAGRPDEAEQLYQQVLTVRSQALGSGHPAYATTLGNLAVLYQSRGKYEAAEELARQALKIRGDTLGEDHPMFARALGSLGSILFDVGDGAAAEPLLRRSLALYERTLGNVHPDLVPVLNELAVLCAVTQRQPEAIILMERVAAIDDILISQIFSISSERERLIYLRGVQANYFAFLSLLLTHLSAQPGCANLGLDLVLRRKGIATEAMAIQRDEALSGRYPELESKLQELSRLRAHIARRMLSSPGDGRDRQSLDDLATRKERLEAELASQIPEIRLSTMLGSAHRQVVAEALPAGSALVEFVRFDILDFNALPARGWRQHRRDARYLALIIPSGQPDSTRMLDLGPATEIDQSVLLFRQALASGAMGVHNDAPQHSAAGERVATPAFSRAVREHSESGGGADALRIGRSLCSTVFEPLLREVDNSTHLFVSQDGDLTLLPLEALPLAHNQYVIDQYRVSYVATGRDILRFSSPAGGHPGPPLVAADPDFDSEGEPAESDIADASPTSTRRSRDLDGWRFNRLRASREEGQLIGNMLDVKPLMGTAVTGPAIKAARSPLILHIATHGFFLADQPDNTDMSLATQGNTRWALMAGLENPLLRSGLALAGANGWLEGKTMPVEGQDGILTAEDVSSMDLASTQLVVLSACDTGLGRVHVGEGVFGLRRAFVLAGARTLVMSLWRVPDRLTQELMVSFYALLLAGRGRAEALRDAQLELKAKYSLPLYWGAFICQGDPGPITALL